MIFYLKEEFLSFDHFDIWDENENLVYSADREFFNFGKKLIVTRFQFRVCSLLRRNIIVDATIVMYAVLTEPQRIL